MRNVLITITTAMLIVGCDFGRGRMSSTERNGIEALVYAKLATNDFGRIWREFNALNVATTERIVVTSNPGFESFEGVATRAAVLHDRYLLLCIVEFVSDESGKEVQFQDYRFRLTEAERITLVDEKAGPSGGASVKTGITEWFSAEDWEHLENAKFDFSVLGINLKTNAPVKHADAIFRAY